MDKKLKTLTLILRSLPVELQKDIVTQLPSAIVKKLASMEVSIDDQLTEEDLHFFYQSWPELANMIDGVKAESKKEELKSLMHAERPKLKSYLAYRLGEEKERPNLPSSICKVIDQVALR